MSRHLINYPQRIINTGRISRAKVVLPGSTASSGNACNILILVYKTVASLQVHQCFSVQKTTQTSLIMMKLVVLSCLLAAASAGVLAPFAYTAPLIAPLNYRGPLSLAPGQPANILAADGRPLDTLEVNLDRSAHLTAKALDGFHLLKKRSIAAPFLAAPISRVALTHAPLIAPAASLYTAPIAHHLSPIAYTAPLAHW